MSVFYPYMLGGVATWKILTVWRVCDKGKVSGMSGGRLVS